MANRQRRFGVNSPEARLVPTCGAEDRYGRSRSDNRLQSQLFQSWPFLLEIFERVLPIDATGLKKTIAQDCNNVTVLCEVL